jgi:hypothetical protein
MDKQINAIYFVVVIGDRLIIPCFDVSRCDMKQIDHEFLSHWRSFIHNLQMQFVSVEKSVTYLQSNGYQIKCDGDYTTVLPTHWKGGFIYNFPDLYDASSDQIFEFLERSLIDLDDLLIKSNSKHFVVNFKVTPETFINLSLNNSSRLAKIADDQKSCKRIWLSIIIWWKYHDGDTSSVENLVEIIEKHCLPDIFRWCNYFIMLYGRAIELKDDILLSWLNHNMSKVIWDDDLLSDVSTYHMHLCSNSIDNTQFKREFARRYCF